MRNENATKVVLLKNIVQKDNHTFSITWSDGSIDHFRLSELQKNCPCAGCVDEITGKRIANAQKVSDNVTALRIENVGHYALKVHFTTGCSRGIYSFDYLRRLV